MALNIIVNEEALELSDSAVIALTKQIVDISKLLSIKADASNSISVPLTDKNRRILEYSDTVNSTTVLPYRRIPCRVVQDNIEIVSRGYGVIDEAAGSFKVTIFTGNIDWSIQLEGKKLEDIEFYDGVHFWNLADQAATHTSPNGKYVYPPTETDNIGNLSYIAPNTFLPAMQRCYVYFKVILERIFSAINYTITGDVLSDEYYNRALLECSKFDFSKKWHIVSGDTENDILCERGTFGSAGIFYREGSLYFPDNVVDPLLLSPWMGITTFLNETTPAPRSEQRTRIVPQKGGLFVFELDLWIDVIAINYLGPLNPNLQTYRIESNYPLDFVGNYTNKWKQGERKTVRFTVSAGALLPIDIWLRCDAFGAGIHEHMNFRIKAGSSLKVLDFSTDVNTYQLDPFNPAWNLPEITQVDFVKAFCSITGRVPVPDVLGGKIRFVRWDEIQERKADALDWSDKLNTNFETSVKYRLSGWGQRNYFRYKDDLDGGLFPNFARGEILVEDEWLPLERDAVQLPFSPTDTNPDGIPYILRSTTAFQWNRPGEPRILMARDNAGTIIYDDFTTIQSISPYIEGYFIRPDDVCLAFDNALLLKNYGFVSAFVQRPKLLTVELLLRAPDVELFDPVRPIYLRQFASYFFVSKISNWIEGKLTRVDLIRL